MRIVMKFGGSCFKDSHGFKEVVSRVTEEKDSEVAVVTSAMYGVTDSILEIASELARGGHRDIEEFCLSLKEKHFDVLRKLVSDENVLREVEDIIAGELSRLAGILNGVFTLEELTPKTKDHLLSFGERLSTPILYAALKDGGLESEYLTGHAAGIVTDSKFNKARPLMDLTEKNVRKNVLPLLQKRVVPVVTGFIAADASGTITTMGRGGSDRTATVLGACLDADQIWLWKDVDGFMTTDPKLEPKARLLPRLSYNEAVELAFFGSRVIQAQALEPVLVKRVPILIKNFKNPEGKGTVIDSDSEKGVKAVSIWKTVALVDIQGSGKLDMPATISRIFSQLDEHDVETAMFSQGSSEIGVSIIIPKDNLERAEKALRPLKEEGVLRDIILMPEICTIAVVGKGLRHTPGIAGRVFDALGDLKINVLVLARGSSDYTFSFVVAEKDGKNAVSAIHEAFGLGKISRKG